MKHRHSGTYKSRTPKGFVVYKRRPKHTHKLSKEHRSIFQKLDRKPYEVGGYMDFNKNGLERADIYIGEEASVAFDASPDKEIQYHTHIQDKDKVMNRLNMFPSKTDVKEFKKYPSQAMLIFHNDKAMVVKKNEGNKLNGKLLNSIENEIQRNAQRMTTDQLFKKYKPKYRRLGLELNYIKHTNAIKLPIDIIEPVKKQAYTKKEMWPFEIEDPIEKGLSSEGRFMFKRMEPREEED